MGGKAVEGVEERCGFAVYELVGGKDGRVEGRRCVPVGGGGEVERYWVGGFVLEDLDLGKRVEEEEVGINLIADFARKGEEGERHVLVFEVLMSTNIRSVLGRSTQVLH